MTEQAQGARRAHETHEALAEIEREHRLLGRALARIGVATELGSLAAWLHELRRLLVTHFEREEALDGFGGVIEEHGPHLLPRLQRVMDEHAEILAEVDRLQADIRRCLDGPVAEILGSAKALTTTLKRHEQEENALLEDAMYTDIGSGS